jgi:hypothetical protein
VVTKVTDYYWTLTMHYEFVAFQGNNVENKVALWSEKVVWGFV